MWTRRLCPALLFLGSLILFLCTLAPTVTFVDSGELIVTARNLGVAHPPGFPLYLLVVHLATLLPFGTVAQRVHFASAVCAALAVCVLYLITIECVASMRARSRKQSSGEKGKALLDAAADERFAFIPGLLSGLLAAFSRTLWFYATVAEVYTLNALLILLTLLFVLRWRNRTLRDRAPVAQTGHPRQKPKGISGPFPSSPPASAATRPLTWAAFIFGLSLGVHHVTVGLMLPALAWLVYKTAGLEFFKSRRLAFAFLACLIGASIYIYLPWAASRDPVLNWGNPATLESFLSHVTGRQYQSNLAFSEDQTRREMAQFMQLVFREFGWPWIPAGLVLSAVGIVSLYRKDRMLLAALALAVGCNLLLGLGYEISEDKDAYYLPLFLILTVCAGLGLHVLMGRARPKDLRIAAASGLMVLIVAFSGNFRFNNRHSFFVAKDYIGNIFKTIAPGGLLLTGDWQVASPMLYFQEIEHQRRDVVCIDTLLLKRSWYMQHLEKAHPALMAKSRDAVRSYLEILRRWEKDPGAFERDPELVQRIESHYQAMIDSLIQQHLTEAPVYATLDVMLNPDPAGQPLAKTLGAKYPIVPKGLVFRLFPDRGLHPAELPDLETRGLADGPPAVRLDPVVHQKIVPVYVTMLVNCGRAFSAQGDPVRAKDAYRRALAIDTDMVLERNLLPSANLE